MKIFLQNITLMDFKNSIHPEASLIYLTLDISEKKWLFIHMRQYSIDMENVKRLIHFCSVQSISCSYEHDMAPHQMGTQTQIVDWRNDIRDLPCHKCEESL